MMISRSSTHLVVVATPTDPIPRSGWEDGLAPVAESDIQSDGLARGTRVGDRSDSREKRFGRIRGCSKTTEKESGEGDEREAIRDTLSRHTLRPRVIGASRLQDSGRVILPFLLSFASEEFLLSTRRAPPPPPFYFWTRAADATRGLAIADINRCPSRNRGGISPYFPFESSLATADDLMGRKLVFSTEANDVRRARSLAHRKLAAVRRGVTESLTLTSKPRPAAHPARDCD